MTDGLRFIAAGIAWWIVIEVIRGRSQSQSKGLWWCHITAPLVAAVLVAVGVWLIWAQ